VEFQELLNMAVGLICFLVGWVLNNLKASIDEQRRDMTLLTKNVKEIEVLVAGTYVKRDDMNKLGDAIFYKLDRIESKLDGKVDK